MTLSKVCQQILDELNNTGSSFNQELYDWIKENQEKAENYSLIMTKVRTLREEIKELKKVHKMDVEAWDDEVKARDEQLKLYLEEIKSLKDSIEYLEKALEVKHEWSTKRAIEIKELKELNALNLEHWKELTKDNKQLKDKLAKIEEVSDLFKFTPTYIIKKIMNNEHVCNNFSCNSDDEHEKLDDTSEVVAKQC